LVLSKAHVEMHGIEYGHTGSFLVIFSMFVTVITIGFKFKLFSFSAASKAFEFSSTVV